MDSQITVVCMALVVFVVCSVDQTAAVPQKEIAVTQYTTKYDGIDIDQILSSRRLVINYVHCLLDKKPCSAEGTELRKILPDALKTQCSKCNSTQKNVALRVVDRLQKEFNDEWIMLLDKWDPKRENYKKFEEFLAEEKKKGEIKFSNT